MNKTFAWKRSNESKDCVNSGLLHPQAHHGQDLAGDLTTLCLGAGIPNRRDDYNWLCIIFNNCFALYLSSVFLKPNHVPVLNHHGVLGTGKSAQKSMARRSGSHASTRWCFKVGDERRNVWWITGCWVYSVYQIITSYLYVYMFGLFSFHHIWSQFVLSIGMFIGWPWESPWDTSDALDALQPRRHCHPKAGFARWSASKCTNMYKIWTRFKEIQREHNISDISDIWSTTAPRELSVWAQLLLGPHQFDASESPRSGQRIQDADRQFQGAAALPAPRQTLVNTGEHTQRVYMLTIIKL